jgi:methyl-accepting chemotaxis protein
MTEPTQDSTTGTNETEQIAIDEAGDVTLPVVEVLTGRAFLTGKSGAGKSNSASVIAEELLDNGFPLVIVDTDGEYWGLKEQYEILHVGADEECDLQVSSEHAPKLAELALEDNVPIILDVSGFLEEADGDALVRETARELFQREKKLKKPFLMLVEEIHEYIPEGGGLDDTGKMLIRVAKRGRKRGLGLAGMSQRPADVKKDFITQCDWLLWHRLTWDNDTDVVKRVVGTEYGDEVQDLDDGEAFLMADFLETDVQRVQIRRKRTFDAGATPDLNDFERPDLKSVSGDLVGELEDISDREERRQDRLSQLEQQVEDLKDEKAELEDDLKSARDIQNLAQQMAESFKATDGNSSVSETVDELVDERNELQSELADRDERIRELEARVKDLQKALENRPDIGERAVEAVNVLADEFGVADGDVDALRRKLKRARERIDELEETDASREQTLESDPLENRKVERLVDEMQRRVRGLDEKERKMLRYLMIEGPAGTKDAYKYAGGSPTSSARSEKMKVLRETGLAVQESRGEYDYGLRDHVDGQLGDSFDTDEISVIVGEIEDTIDAVVMQTVDGE